MMNFTPTTSSAQRMVLAACLTLAALPSLAQQESVIPESARRLAPDPSSPAMRARAQLVRTQKSAEKEMRKIRAKYLGDIRVESIRQEGISKMLAFKDPIHFPALVEVTKGEQEDVRSALLDMLATQPGDAANATVAWIAVNEKSDQVRELATQRLRERLGDGGFKGIPSPGVAEVIRLALESGRERQIEAAAQLAQALHMYEAIAWLIPAQLGSSAGGQPGAGGGDLGWIAIGKQTAFVSDLTPVVSNGAVAFDPTLSVITEGVLLRIHDAAVTTYRGGVNRRLIGLSTEATGRSTEGLAWDLGAWKHWYDAEFYPLAVRQRAQIAAQTAAQTAASQPTRGVNQPVPGTPKIDPPRSR